MEISKNSTAPRWATIVGVLILAAVIIAGLVSTRNTTGHVAEPAGVPAEYVDRYKTSPQQVSKAKDLLDQLVVAEPQSMDEYKNNRKELFGDWASGDKQANVTMARNGCDTRNDILGRDMVNVQYSDKKKCKVKSGKLWDVYGTPDNPNNHWIDFTSGKGTSMAVQIDHVVALGNVWASRPKNMSDQDRFNIANDPINLIAVDGPQNGAKQDKNFAEWKPLNKNIHCFYAASQIQVKHKYHLTVTQAEHDDLAKALSKCPSGV